MPFTSHRRAGGVVLLLAMLTGAGQAAAQSKDETMVLDAWATGLPGGGIVAHGKIQIVNGGSDEYRISFQFRYQEKKDLPSVMRRTREDYNYDVQRILPPDAPTKAVWNDLNIPITAGMVARDAMLEEGTHVLRGYWAIQSIGAMRYFHPILNWERGIPMVVDKEGDGSVRIAPFLPRTGKTLADHESERITALLANVKTQHLVPTGAVNAMQTTGVRDDKVTHLRLGGKSVRLDSLERGAFYGPIDSQAKAEELVRLPYGGARIIKTKEQYRALLEELIVKGWKPSLHLSTTPPPGYGSRTRYFKGLGYLVEMLVLSRAGYDDRFGEVRYDIWAVTEDGKLGLTSATYVASPLSDIGQPKGWKQPFPLDRAGYHQVLQKELTAKGSEEIPVSVTVSNRFVRLPAPEGLTAKDFKEPRQ